MAKKKILFVLAAVCLFAASSWAQCSYDTQDLTINFKRVIPGLLDGNFSVSATKKVAFAGGNLMYTKSTGKWKIMDHQYDMVETLSQNVGTDYADQDVVTLFGWGTSGWNNTTADATSVHYQPNSTCNTNHSTANNNFQYGPSLANVAAGESWSKSDSYKNYDWGVFNSGDLGAGWRTLTKDEWTYLLNTANSSDPAVGRQGNRYAKANVHGVNGMILLPDGWTKEASAMSGTLGGINAVNSSFNAITDDDWAKLENEGAVFLPAAGYRQGTTVSNVDVWGVYWASTNDNEKSAGCMYFYLTQVTISIFDQYVGCSVRLVQDVE